MTRDESAASVYSDLLQDAARDLAHRLRPGGWFVFSGCAADKAAATRAATLAAGLSIDRTTVRGRWHTFAGRARGGP